MGDKCLVTQSSPICFEYIKDKTLNIRKDWLLQEHVAPDLLADAHILQESEHWDIILWLWSKPSSL